MEDNCVKDTALERKHKVRDYQLVLVGDLFESFWKHGADRIEEQHTVKWLLPLSSIIRV